MDSYDFWCARNTKQTMPDTNQSYQNFPFWEQSSSMKNSVQSVIVYREALFFERDQQEFVDV